MKSLSKSPLDRFRQLTYSQKFTLITLVFALPVIAFIPLFLDQSTRIDQYGHKELSGTLYLRPLWQLTADLQSYVFIAHEYSDGNQQVSEVNAAQTRVDADVEALQKIDLVYGTSLSTGDTVKALNAQWTEIKKAVQNRDWRGFEAQQSLLFNNLSALTARVGDTSYLILDPDLDTYYLMDMVLLKLPENQGLVFEMLRTSEQAANHGGLSVENQAQLIVLIGRVEANLDAMQRNIDVAIQNDQTGTIEQVLTEPMSSYRTSLQGFADFINAELNKPDPALEMGSEFISSYQNAYNANLFFYSSASQALETGVQNRINRLSVQLYTVVAIALLSILVAFIIGRSMMRSLSLPLRQLFEATRRLAGGDMTTRVPTVRQSAELSQVADAFNLMAQELERDKSALVERTLELDAARSQSEQRTQTLQTISEISRLISSEQRLDVLLPLITQVIGEKLYFYHCAIFLIDEHHKFAVMQAANSLEGRHLLRRGFKIQIADNTAIEHVITTGNPRLVSDGTSVLTQLNQSSLSKIDSMLLLPIRIAGEVSGLLEIQSSEITAFQKEDTNVLLILADQIAITIQNARSFEQAEHALHEVEAASRQLTAQAWQGFLETAEAKGYRYDGIKPEPLKTIQKSTEETDTLLIPIQLRGQIIGRLKLRVSDAKRKWTDDERAIIESTADRVAIALESARLLEDAQKRASRETFLSEIGTKLGASFQLDSILRDAVEELGQTLKGSTVSFQLVNPSAPPPEHLK